MCLTCVFLETYRDIGAIHYNILFFVVSYKLLIIINVISESRIYTAWPRERNDHIAEMLKAFGGLLPKKRLSVSEFAGSMPISFWCY